MKNKLTFSIYEERHPDSEGNKLYCMSYKKDGQNTTSHAGMRLHELVDMRDTLDKFLGEQFTNNFHCMYLEDGSWIIRDSHRNHTFKSHINSQDSVTLIAMAMNGSGRYQTYYSSKSYEETEAELSKYAAEYANTGG